MVTLACVVPRGRWMYVILGLLILYFLNWLPELNPLQAAVEAKL
jgi:lipopolysaccharide export system protein LptC